MEITKARQFTADRAWGSKCIANMQGITTKLHWTDQDYIWHVNDGQEVFVVLDGQVNMHYKNQGESYCELLEVGDIFYANVGVEHRACPIGEARILVIEKQGSV